MQEMASAISKGKMIQEDGRLPSETELSQQFGVSRATVREVLARLESAGVVVRRQGIGTFISEPLRSRPGMIWGWLDQAPAFVDLISASGYDSNCDLLSTSTVAAGDVADYLNIPTEEEVVVIEKLFLADDTPIIYSWTTLPKSLVTTCEEENTLAPEAYSQSIYEVLQQHCGHHVAYQSSEIHAVQADPVIAGHLRCEVGAPLIHVAEIGYAREGLPLFYAVHFFRGDRVSFRQIRIPTFTVEPL
jgi:GntR family transcriptional regulator